MITLENVTKSFTSHDEGEQLALNPINLNVAEGEFLCIVGPSGCGKTTLLRMIAGLDFPTSGRVLEGENEITGPSRERGYVFQQYSLFPWRDVGDNVAFGLEMEGLEKKRGTVRPENI